MLICFNKDSVVEVSFHRFAESFLILEGIAHYRFYSNKNGTVFHDVRMSPAKLKGIFIHLLAHILRIDFSFIYKYNCKRNWLF